MFRNYFNLALHTFFQHKTYPVIHLPRLGSAITCCFLLGLFWQQAWGCDRTYNKYDRLTGAFHVNSYLGLFGLAILAVTRRTKEIGVRQVQGALVDNIVGLVSNIFYWVGGQFVGLAGAVTLLIALVPVNFHLVRVALANPVKRLRTR